MAPACVLLILLLSSLFTISAAQEHCLIPGFYTVYETMKMQGQLDAADCENLDSQLQFIMAFPGCLDALKDLLEEQGRC